MQSLRDRLELLLGLIDLSLRRRVAEYGGLADGRQFRALFGGQRELIVIEEEARRTQVKQMRRSALVNGLGRRKQGRRGTFRSC